MSAGHGRGRFSRPAAIWPIRARIAVDNSAFLDSLPAVGGFDALRILNRYPSGYVFTICHGTLAPPVKFLPTCRAANPGIEAASRVESASAHDALRRVVDVIPAVEAARICGAARSGDFAALLRAEYAPVAVAVSIRRPRVLNTPMLADARRLFGFRAALASIQILTNKYLIVADDAVANHVAIRRDATDAGFHSHYSPRNTLALAASRPSRIAAFCWSRSCLPIFSISSNLLSESTSYQ